MSHTLTENERERGRQLKAPGHRGLGIEREKRDVAKVATGKALLFLNSANPWPVCVCVCVFVCARDIAAHRYSQKVRAPKSFFRLLLLLQRTAQSRCFARDRGRRAARAAAVVTACMHKAQQRKGQEIRGKIHGHPSICLINPVARFVRRRFPGERPLLTPASFFCASLVQRPFPRLTPAAVVLSLPLALASRVRSAARLGSSAIMKSLAECGREARQAGAQCVWQRNVRKKEERTVVVGVNGGCGGGSVVACTLCQIMDQRVFGTASVQRPLLNPGHR